MKKPTLLTILLCLGISLTLFADEVTLKAARQTAFHFYLEKFNYYRGPLDLQVLKINDTHIEYSNGLPVYYIFSMSPGGFVIVPAEDALLPVLGYSLDEKFGFEGQPPNVRYWMNQYAEQVQFARAGDLEPEAKIRSLWQKYLVTDFVPSRERDDWGQVGPLLTTSWDQGWPYNYYCPADPSGPGGHTYAGCVATACAQIGYYYRWPGNGLGYYCYTPLIHPEYGEQCADFENTWYRFDEMVDHPASLNTAIAEYLYHFGVAFEMDYDPSGSAPGNLDTMDYFLKFLPYEVIYRDDYGCDSLWISFLKDEVDALRPLFYGGDPVSPPGHAFVCDGYQDSAYFHFNLGWGGQSNGYYFINDLAGYNYNQFVVYPAYPDTIQYVYPPYFSGNDTLDNLVGSIEDGSGPIHNYLSNTQASWLIDPQNEQDSVTRITLTFKRFDLFEDDDRLTVYDGADNTAPLLAELTGNALPSPITSSGNKVFIEFITGNSETGSGFYLNYACEQPVWCSGTTQLTATSALFDDGSGMFNYYDSKLCKWIINPGISEPLSLHFNYFKTEADKDFLNIYDYQSQELLAEISGNYENPPEPVTSPSGKMMVFFVTNNNIKDDGWEAWYDVSTSIAEENRAFKISISPNPFHDLTIFSFTLQERLDVRIEIFNHLGQKVENLEEGPFAPGYHQVTWNAGNLPAGIYFYRLQAGNQSATGKIVLTR